MGILPRLDVIAGQRHSIHATRQLQLKYDESVLAECGFGTGQIKIPHPAEIFPKPAFDRFPIGMQALSPGGQRRWIVLAPHFDVGDEQPLLFQNARLLPTAPAYSRRGKYIC